MNNLLMWSGHHTLPTDLNDAVTDSDSAPLGNSSSHQTADLQSTKMYLETASKNISNIHLLCVWSKVTHNAILNAKAELISEIWSADEDHGDGRTSDDVHLDSRLRL